MIKKTGIFFLVAALLLVFTAACTPGPESPPTSPAAFVDQLGRTVTMPAGVFPRKIVSLAPSNTEILYALGLADSVVGVTDYDDYPPEVKQKKSIGGFSTPNIEEVVALAPDLVVASQIHKDKIIPQLEARGLTVVALNPKTIAQVMEAITLVGKITGKTKEAESVTRDMQRRVERVTNKTKGLAESLRPKTLYVVWHDPLMTAGQGTLQDELIALAGGRSIGAGLSGYADISLEKVVIENPGVIIAGDSMGNNQGQIFNAVNGDARLKDTVARRDGRVYAIDANLASRPGPRIVKALEEFLALIHPELRDQP